MAEGTYQLPPDIANFVNRHDEQARACRAAAERNGQARPLVITLSGLCGSGKTELAFRIARKLHEDYQPDGVLYIDLDELRRGGVVETADAQGKLLGSLGVRGEFLEQSFAARHRQYWDQTGRKRLVVVVDNARYGTELLPLLPSSSESVVIAASHGQLRDLENGAAVELPLRPLTDEHARELLHRIVADPRLAEEPEAVEGFVRLCSGLPVALHVAGRWMRNHRRRSLSRLLTELAAEVEEKGLPEVDVDAVWNIVYRELSREAARLYRLLPEHPGLSLSAEAAAALLDQGKDAADDALDELESAGLVEIRDGRLRLHELLRAHARRCARRDGDAAEPADARRVLVRWYLRQAQRADAMAAGERLTFGMPVPHTPSAPDVTFAGKPDALHWLETERHALYGCVALAHALGMDEEASALCEPVWTHYLDHPHYADVLDAFRTGLASAQRAGRSAFTIRMRCQLARPLWEQGHFVEAEAELRRAMNGLSLLGSSERERKLGGSVLEFRGRLRFAQRDWTGAAQDFEASLAVHRALKNAYGVMLQQHQLGQALTALGQPERAVALLEQAHRAARELGRERMTARTGFELAQVLRRLGQLTEAGGLYTAALDAARARGSEYDQARIHDALGVLAEETGDEAGAREHQDAARAIRERCGALVRPTQ